MIDDVPTPPGTARPTRRLTRADRDQLDRISAAAFRAATRIDDGDAEGAWSAIAELRGMMGRLPR